VALARLNQRSWLLLHPQFAAFAHARPRAHNAFKIALGKRTLIRALQQAAAMEIPT